MARLLILTFLLFLSATSFAKDECIKGFWHRISWGETLSSIAARYGTDISTLARANHIKNIDKIRVNRKIWIPGYKIVRARVYTVKKGDYLVAIANKYKTNLWSLASLNGIFDLNRIFPGQRIYIPLE